MTTVPAATPTRAVDRALALLASVCDEAAPNLTECARLTGLPASTALRLLRTLESAGFVTREPDGTYRPGDHLVRLGARAFGRQELARRCTPALARLVEASGESAYLSVLGPGDTALYVATVEGTHSIRHASWVGRTVPVAGSAAGAALQGRVPARGYVVVRAAVEADVVAIAAPVHRPGGIAAALSIVGPDYRIDDAAAATYGRLLATEAAAVAATFGADRDPSGDDAHRTPDRRPMRVVTR